MNVRMANKMAEETENGVMVQDTAWDGYEKFRLGLCKDTERWR